MSRKKRLIVTAIVLCVCMFSGVWYGMSGTLCKMIEKGDTDGAIAMIDRMSAGHINTYSPPPFIGAFTGILTQGASGSELPLVMACSEGNYELVKALLENGANPNKYNGSGAPIEVVYTHYRHENRYDIAELLIEYGADVNLHVGWATALDHELRRFSFDDVDEMETYRNIKYLLDNGADFYNTDSGQVIDYAVIHNRAEATRAFIENNYAEVNYIVENGTTPLMWGARDGSTETVRVLLEYGADKTIQDPDGKTAYDYAIENGHTELAELLKP